MLPFGKPCPDVAEAETMRKKAFTLIELLVVISVIALLLAIFLPVLGRVRTAAKSLACQSKLRQWGLVFSACAADQGPAPLGFSDGPWWYASRRYYHDEDLLLCPEATKPSGPRTLPFVQRQARRAWRLDYYCEDTASLKSYIASYGVNYWLTETVGLRRHAEQFGHRGNPYAELWYPKHWYWNPRAIPSSRIPLVFDCITDGGTPDDFDEPPVFDGDFSIGSWGGDGMWWQTNHMRWECLNRHAPGQVNVTFLDGSTRPIGFKELWTLKWHSQFNTTGPWTTAGGAISADWPAWMRRFKDY